MLISKTFDSSVICPAEQTCIIDEPVWDAMVAELQRLGARLLSEDEVAALSAAAFDDGAVQLQTVGQSCLNLGALAGFEAEIDDKVLLAPLPTDLEALVAHPLAAEKLMPVLGLVRSPVGRARDRGGRGDHRARRPRPHLGGLRDRRGRRRGVLEARAHGPHPRQRPDGGRRPRRRLQRDDADVLARLRDLGRLADDRQHQLPQPAQHQGGLAPPDAAAVVPRPVGHLLQPGRARDPAHAALRAGADRHRRRHRGARRRRRGAPPPRRAGAGVRRRRARAERGDRARRGRGRAQTCGPT